MTAQKGQSQKKSHLGNLYIMLEIQPKALGPGESTAGTMYLSLIIFV